MSSSSMNIGIEWFYQSPKAFTFNHYTWIILNPCIPTCPLLKYNHNVSTLNQCILSMVFPCSKRVIIRLSTFAVHKYRNIKHLLRPCHVVLCGLYRHKLFTSGTCVAQHFWISWQLQDSSKAELETTGQFKVRKSHCLRKSGYNFRMHDNNFNNKVWWVQSSSIITVEREKMPTGWREWMRDTSPLIVDLGSYVTQHGFRS